MLEQWIEVKILNFESFNPRGDVKRPSWFRLDHDMVADSDFYSFSDAEFRAWIYILSMASKKNADGVVRLHYDHAERVCKVASDVLNGAIKRLLKLGIVSRHVAPPNADVTSTNAHDTHTNADVTSTNAHDTHTNADVTSTNANERYETGRNETLRNEHSFSDASKNESPPDRRPDDSKPELFVLTPPKPKRRRLSKGADPAPTTAAWDAYADAYLGRHGASPARDRMSNVHLKAIIESVGAPDAPDIVAYFVRHNDALYVRSRHPLNLLRRDIQKVRTDWLTGSQMTSASAKQVDDMQSTRNAFDQVRREMGIDK